MTGTKKSGCLTMKNRTIKGKFREAHGYSISHNCGECVYCIKYTGTKRNFYKCKKIGVTMSSATDIRLKDSSCDLFEEIVE